MAQETDSRVRGLGADAQAAPSMEDLLQVRGSLTSEGACFSQ